MREIVPDAATFVKITFVCLDYNSNIAGLKVISLAKGPN